MGAVVLVALAGCTVAVAVVWRRHRARSWRARFLRRTAFVVTAVLTVAVGLEIVGEAVSDPGGWEALGLVASWAVPTAALGAAAWFQPRLAQWVLGALVVALVGLSAWSAADPAGWRAFEDQHGPIRAVAIFGLAAALGPLGLRRPGPTGVLLLVVGIVPAACAAPVRGPFVALVVTAAFPVVTGSLDVAAALVGRGPSPPVEDAAPGRARRAA